MKKKKRKKYSIKKRKIPSGWYWFDRALEAFLENPGIDIEDCNRRLKNAVQQYIDKGMI